MHRFPPLTPQDPIPLARLRLVPVGTFRVSLPWLDLGLAAALILYLYWS